MLVVNCACTLCSTSLCSTTSQDQNNAVVEWIRYVIIRQTGRGEPQYETRGEKEDQLGFIRMARWDLIMNFDVALREVEVRKTPKVLFPQLFCLCIQAMLLVCPGGQIANISKIPQ